MYKKSDITRFAAAILWIVVAIRHIIKIVDNTKVIKEYKESVRRYGYGSEDKAAKILQFEIFIMVCLAVISFACAYILVIRQLDKYGIFTIVYAVFATAIVVAVVVYLKSLLGSLSRLGSNFTVGGFLTYALMYGSIVVMGLYCKKSDEGQRFDIKIFIPVLIYLSGVLCRVIFFSSKSDGTDSFVINGFGENLIWVGILSLTGLYIYFMEKESSYIGYAGYYGYPPMGTMPGQTMNYPPLNTFQNPNMFCTQCGSEIPDGSKFCKACGAEQRRKDTSQAEMYMSAQPNPYMQVKPYMMANPYAQPNPYDPAVREEMKARRKEKFTKFLKIFANIVAILGVLINATPFIGFIVMTLPRYKDDYLDEYDPDFFRTYEYGILKIVLILIAVSLAAYIVLFISKRVLYTFFYPVITVILSILFLIITKNYISAYREDNLINYGYDSVPEYIKRAQTACTFLVVLSVLIFLSMLLYNIKGFKWALWLNLLFGAGAVFFGALAIGQITNVSDGMFYMAGNFFGYCFLVLLYAFAYKDKNKPLLNGKA